MPSCKTVVTSVHMQWSYCSLALNHQCILSIGVVQYTNKSVYPNTQISRYYDIFYTIITKLSTTNKMIPLNSRYYMYHDTYCIMTSESQHILYHSWVYISYHSNLSGDILLKSSPGRYVYSNRLIRLIKNNFWMLFGNSSRAKLICHINHDTETKKLSTRLMLSWLGII